MEGVWKFLEGEMMANQAKWDMSLSQLSPSLSLSFLSNFWCFHLFKNCYSHVVQAMSWFVKMDSSSFSWKYTRNKNFRALWALEILAPAGGLLASLTKNIKISK